MADDSQLESVSKHVSKDIVWDDRPRTLRQIMTSCRLPFHVKIHRGDLSKYIPASSDQNDVLHVLEVRRRKIVLGRRLQWEKRANDYTVTGDQLDIPASFKGWFEVVPDDGRPVEYFDTINGITSVKPRRFLVRTSTVGYQLSIEDGVSCWMPCEIKSGEVLTTGMIYMDNKKTKSVSKNIFKKLLKSHKTSKKEQDMKYLQCYDSEGKEIMIPLIMSGVFSPVGDATVANYDAVYELQDLIMAFGLPVNAQIIYSGASEKATCPNGTVKFESTREEEYAIVKRSPLGESEGEPIQVELPMDGEVTFFKEAKKRVAKKDPDPKYPVPSEESKVDVTSNIELPKRVDKEAKKSKTSALLDKLSVRRTKKERAKLKAMKGDDVFSRRLSKNDVSYEEFFNGLNSKEEDKENSERNKQKSPDSETTKNSKEDTYGKIHKSHIQNRDLPPIPPDDKGQGHTGGHSDHNKSKDSIYEHLPPAPKPPSRSFSDLTRMQEEDEDDGYMVPMNLKGDFDTAYSEGTDAILRRKPPSVPRDSMKYARTRKARSEIPCHGEEDFHDNCPFNIDDLFSFAYSQESKEKPYGTISSRYNVSTSQLYGSNNKAKPPPWRAHIPNSYDPRFFDDQDIDIRQRTVTPSKYKSKSQRNLNMDPNATIRSHNLRKMRNVMEVFHFSDSFRDLRGGEPPSPDHYHRRHFENPYGMTHDPSAIYYPGSGHGQYIENEPPYRKYHRSASVSGLSDPYLKQGDDSAISMGSRGDYGYPNGSDYSYSEYGEPEDENYIPPEETEHLSVKEVSKCLRYIGMKDRVVLRFSNEQIDGEMLGRLDKKLLKEGFPELNALEIKKILDFIGGWRPKKA
ncbi:LOW QUALITY PROTEIN: uncharacterized protein LOC124284634 [Haliotis rubra]|uniref:LOW QUALITY PROTEIN: uncharacterized protein LOC124284634 n=1 Tax=Haliotis rubra TaxID=36100 RepID=UPI001EE553FB|nr:LOW QUALITY PROTEIN: uncharacterized protein LOC124284634 [Haliotis rubra]